MNLSLPGPAGQTHPECLGSQAFPGCMHAGSTCPRFLCTLCMYQGLRDGKQVRQYPETAAVCNTCPSQA